MKRHTGRSLVSCAIGTGIALSMLGGCAHQYESPARLWERLHFWNQPDSPVEDEPDWQNVRFQDSSASGGRSEPDLVSESSRPTEALGADVAADRPAAEMVAEVRITGNQSVPTHQILRHVRTRPGRHYDPDLLQQDVDQLWRHEAIRRIRGPYLERTAEGLIITIDVVERLFINQVQFVGNRAVSDRRLRDESGIRAGQPLDVHAVRMGKQRIEDYYRENGFPLTQVEIVEGDQIEDQNVVFLIHEDQKKRIFRVTFEGNTIASNARLASLVKAKAGIFWLIGGQLDRHQIQQDVTRLTAYYRGLGFFNARIGRELIESGDGRWVTVKYIIDEGPRYQVRSVSFIGNEHYSDDQLASAVELKPLEQHRPFFSAAQMNQDVQSLSDAYGTQGFVFADVVAEPRFLEEPGMLDLVYRISEGEQYRIGKINVVIQGDFGVTRRQVVLNHMGLRPGDLIDTRKLRAAEARLRRSQLFADGGAGSPGPPPQVTIQPPELQQLDGRQRR